MAKLNILYVYADSSGAWNSSQWRCLTPANAINKIDGWSAKLVDTKTFAVGKADLLIDKADVVVFQHNIVLDVFKNTIDMLRGIGKTVVVDIDDAYRYMPVSNSSYEFWMQPDENGMAKHEVLADRIREADTLTSPSELILQDYEAKNKYLIKNLAESNWWLNNDIYDFKTIDANRRAIGLHDKTIIGWGGSVSHLASWLDSGIVEATGLLDRKDVAFLICGFDKRIYDLVKTKSKAYLGYMMPNEWVETIQMFDIGVAPISGVYDSRRSNLKVMEYSLAGVPWIVSDLPPYQKDFDFGVLVENSSRSWHVAMHAMAMNISDEKEIAREQMVKARERYINIYNKDTYVDIFSNIHKSNSYRWKSPIGVTYVNWR